MNRLRGGGGRRRLTAPQSRLDLACELKQQHHLFFRNKFKSFLSSDDSRRGTEWLCFESLNISRNIFIFSVRQTFNYNSWKKDGSVRGKRRGRRLHRRLAHPEAQRLWGRRVQKPATKTKGSALETGEWPLAWPGPRRWARLEEGMFTQDKNYWTGEVSLYGGPPVLLVRIQLLWLCKVNSLFIWLVKSKTSQTGGQLYSDTSPYGCWILSRPEFPH